MTNKKDLKTGRQVGTTQTLVQRAYKKQTKMRGYDKEIFYQHYRGSSHPHRIRPLPHHPLVEVVEVVAVVVVVAVFVVVVVVVFVAVDVVFVAVVVDESHQNLKRK